MKKFHDIIKDKIHVPVCYATDNNYVFPILVSMTSLVETIGPNTFYDIYVLHPNDLKKKNKRILKSVEENHYGLCSVTLIDMKNKYKDKVFRNKTSSSIYYRLDIHNLLPNTNRTIYMDGDTLVFEDLSNLIKLDMKNNYIMGFLDNYVYDNQIFGISNSTVICAGVLLIDLDALRKNNYTEKFNKFMIEQKKKILKNDQTVINVVLHDKIGPLPPKYGIWGFNKKWDAMYHNEIQMPWLMYNISEYKHAIYRPAIVHLVSPKPHLEKGKSRFTKQWWYFANISGYYNDIYKFKKSIEK